MNMMMLFESAATEVELLSMYPSCTCILCVVRLFITVTEREKDSGGAFERDGVAARRRRGEGQAVE